VEASANLLATAWCTEDGGVRAAFLPQATSAADRGAVLLLLGRLLVLLRGDEEASRLLIPVLSDTVVAHAGERVPASLYAVAGHVLAHVAAACAAGNNRWGYNHAVDILLKMHKFPQFSIAAALLHGVSNMSKHPIDAHVVGNCPGALAAAFLVLSDGIQTAPPNLCKDWRQRLLALYSDFALLLPNESYVADLGALLLPISRSLRHVAGHGALQNRGGSFAMSSTNLSLDALVSIQEEDRALSTGLRHIWLSSAVWDFASLLTASGGLEKQCWPAHLSGALSSIAEFTPVLLLGSEQQKSQAFQEALAAEYSGWLAALGQRGEARRLVQQLTAVLRGAPTGASVNLPGPLAAHLLTISYKALTHAMHQEATWLEPDSNLVACPLTTVLAHMQYSTTGSLGYPWLARILAATFDAYIDRLIQYAASNEVATTTFALAAAEETARLLTGALVFHGYNNDLPKAAYQLLTRLITSFPGLLFSEAAFEAALRAVGEHDAQQSTASGHESSFSVVNKLNRSLPRAWMLKLVGDAAAAAPSTAEAVVVEHLRTLAAQGGRHAAVVVVLAPEVMHAVQTGRLSCSLPDVSGPFKGLVAWSAKVGSLGAVVGLGEGLGDQVPEANVVHVCARALLSAIQEGATDRILEQRCAEAAAAIVQYDSSPAAMPLLRIIAWLPLARDNVRVMQATVAVWHWLLAAGSSTLRDALFQQIAAAWQSSVAQRLGMFSRTARNSDVDAETGQDEASVLQSISGHHCLVVFLTEVWRSKQHVVLAARSHLYTALCQILSASLGNIHDCPITAHPAAIAARFRLLHLAIAFSCSAVRMPSRLPHGFSCTQLYKCVVESALAWFANPVSWYEAGKKEGLEAAAAIRDFATIVRQAPGLIGPTRAHTAVKSLANEMRSPHAVLLQNLLPNEVTRLALWADPLEILNPVGSTLTLHAAATVDWKDIVRSAWTLSPHLALALGERYPGVRIVSEELENLVRQECDNPAVQAISAAAYYHAASISRRGEERLQTHYWSNWAPLPLHQAVALMSGQAGRQPEIRAFLLRSLAACDPERLAIFLPQLVQLLRHDPDAAVEDLLLSTASSSAYFAYLLVCQLASEGTPPAEAFQPVIKRSNWTPPQDTGMWRIADNLRQRLWDHLHGPVRERLTAQLSYFEEITAVSGKLYSVSKEERKAAAVNFLRAVKVPREDLFMPTDPHSRVLAVKPDSAAPMQSAAKCPFLAAFDVEPLNFPGGQGAPTVEAAIFKVGDDCRQDVLALQVLSLLKERFDRACLTLPLFPYAVVPTGYEQGIIEVIPNAKSRAQLGELTDGGLFEIFQREFGLPGSPRFEAAREAFIASSAAYAVASYLLQAKDRHNGNIMVDNQGHVIHIDFGYIFGISPGGNMGFESAAFKLSFEMTQLLDPGNTRSSPQFLRFQELCIKGYLAVRSAADTVVATVAIMERSGLPCFGFGAPVENLRQRFHEEMDDLQAAAFMQRLIQDAYDKWTTGVYDLIQYYQNRITF
jgi:phosphatidylinositol 4-kinase A